MRKNMLESVEIKFVKSKERRVPCLVWYFTSMGVTTITAKPITKDLLVADYPIRSVNTIVVGKILPISMVGTTVTLINGVIA